MAPIHPVILCGGSGTRLWPKSRKARPKPFIPLIGNTTLFRAAVERCADREAFAEPIVVAGADHVALIQSQLEESSANATVIVEPAARNTAPAIALAAHMLEADAVMLVCPSDHHIANTAAFRDAAAKAARLAQDGWLVSFGIAPDRPETGYGYLQQGEALDGGYRVAQFVEKPDLAGAEAFLATGDYAWNGGIFAFTAGRYLEELQQHRPAIAEAVQSAYVCGQSEGSCFLPSASNFEAIKGESIDYAVMESTDRAAMVPVDMGWSDIGNWAALHDALEPDEKGNSVSGPADLSGCVRTLVMTDGPRVSAVGLEDICIVVDGDEILVTSRDGAQLVGKLPGATSQ